MAGFFLKRLINAVLVLVGVVTLTFCLMRFTDGDPATIIALDKYGSSLISNTVIDRLAAENGLCDPLPIQYLNWVRRVLAGDLGRSLRSDAPVWDEIMQRFPYTLQLAVLSILLTSAIAIPLGIYAGVHQDSLVDRLTQWIASITVSVPDYYLAIVLIYGLTVKWTLLPSYGYGSVAHFVLPLAVLVSARVGYTTRLVTSTTADLMSADYVAYAELRGLPSYRIFFVHILKNALIPIVTHLSLQFLMALEGSVIVESIFAWPGIGKCLTDAVLGRDFTMIQGLVLFMGVLIVGMNVIVDFFYILMDQRVQVAGTQVRS
ncbi:oligopeptide/dipeptide ABC transporter, periplasmic binding protein [Desulfosarcina variabilis str. Montpellier]|uniref:ABC transporter permease n=1 Tax=Desulfosarcina variabilis TaxID=2300 RepID=UPI003AFA7B29